MSKPQKRVLTPLEILYVPVIDFIPFYFNFYWMRVGVLPASLSARRLCAWCPLLSLTHLLFLVKFRTFCQISTVEPVLKLMDLFVENYVSLNFPGFIVFQLGFIVSFKYI